MTDKDTIDLRHLYMTLGRLEEQSASNLAQITALREFVTEHMKEEEGNIKSLNKRIGILAIVSILILAQSAPWGKLIPLIIAIA